MQVTLRELVSACPDFEYFVHKSKRTDRLRSKLSNFSGKKNARGAAAAAASAIAEAATPAKRPRGALRVCTNDVVPVPVATPVTVAGDGGGLGTATAQGRVVAAETPQGGGRVRKTARAKPAKKVKPTWQEGSIVWARMAGFPWWPARVCREAQTDLCETGAVRDLVPL